MNNSLEWRRSKVSELSSRGYNQSEISRVLQISQSTINRDIIYLRQQAKTKSKDTLTSDYQKNTRNVLLD
jgi:DeoR/GlpR family transcriptional regulator of sugar metabolism